jgi:rhamnogalacturonan endolyase
MSDCKYISLVTILWLGISAGYCQPATISASAVKIGQDESGFTLSNGIVRVVISKKSGSITSLSYKDKQMLAGRGDRAAAMWSHDATSSSITHAITIDPEKNNGMRGEIAIKGISGGMPMGNGPGGSFIADIEIRYALAKGESGVYTYCTFDHLPQYPASSMGEARFVAFLDKTFDWMRVDEKRDKFFPLPRGAMELNKYTLTAIQHENPAFGWISTANKIGFWLVNSSMEYMSGGPTKVDFLCHRDTRIDGAPCVLNYWRSSHYGGATVNVEAGERWTKTIGPFLLYMNEGKDVAAIKQDALARATTERNQWPYKWVNAPDYPLAQNRGVVKGRLILKDPLTSPVFSRLRVGICAPDYTIKPTPATTRIVDWQYDAKYYQFWAIGNTKGEFNIENIRPGKYTLHAMADGVLGEFIKTDIEIVAGEKIDLGALEWTPLRYGKQLWDIGIANRNGAEFAGGNRFFEDAIVKQYPVLFPNDVNYTIGKSDFRKDWFFEQLPHVDNPESVENNTMPEATQQALIKALGIDALNETDRKTAMKTIADLGQSGKYARGRATSWKINFNITEAITGKVMLRTAISGTGTTAIAVTVNDQPIGKMEDLRIDGTPNRSGSSGMWYERVLTFDASLLKKGNNTLSLTIPAGPVVNGIMYDYLRLEHQTLQ